MDEKPVPQASCGTATYWENAAHGRLALQICPACDQHVFHPRRWCPRCFGRDLQWREACGRGEIHTYSVICAAPGVGFEDAAPYVLAVIELEEGPRMMANVIDCPVDAVHVGLRVEVVFEARGGMHLPQFRPVATDRGSAV